MRKKYLLLVTSFSLVLVGTVVLSEPYFSKEYPSELTAKAYNDTISEKSVTLVFYKHGCPYCEAAMPRIKKAAKQSSVTTFYVDVETADGKVLVNRFNIQHAPTMVTIRNGAVTVSPYAYDKDDKLTVDTHVINNAFQIP